MDEAAINAAGIAPLQPELDGLKAIKTPAAGLTPLARLQSFGVGVGFRCGSSPDLKQSERERAVLGQGGLGFPERGYYFNDDEKSLKIRHVGRLEAPWVDARKGDPAAAVRVADREMAAGPGRPLVAANAAQGGDECVARVEPGGGPRGGRGRTAAARPREGGALSAAGGRFFSRAGRRGGGGRSRGP